MITIGLTGGIGSGKTTVAGFFRDLGIPVYIADEEAKKLMITPALSEPIIALLGKEAYTNGELNRAFIADQVFKNIDLLQQLNKIVHPVVAAHFKEWMGKQKAPYVIKEAAILFENGTYTSLSANILVTAPQAVRIERVMKRDATTERKVKDRMKQQWDDSKKRDLADFIIENTQLEKTEKETRKIHVKIMGTLVNS